MVKALILVQGCAYGPPVSPPSRSARAPVVVIDTIEMRVHTAVLAHDSMNGRATGSPGGDRTAAYLAAHCARMGLQALDGGYFQTVPLVELSIASDTRLLLAGGDGESAVFHHADDFVLDFGPPLGELAAFTGELVYLNTPLVSADLPAVRDRIVATVGPLGDGEGLAQLERHGARGVLQLGADARLFDLYARSRGSTRLSLADSMISASLTPPIPVMVGGPALTQAVLRGTTLAAGSPMRSGPLDQRMRLEAQAVRRPLTANNVACWKPGTAPRQRDTAIVYTAHYDHLGVGAPDERGDSIYNGFSDNAAGVAMLLAMARAMQGPQAPHYSVLFLFFTGEEQGLLGSDYYVARPLWPLSRVRGVINLDAGAPAARPASWRIAGGQGTPLGLLAVDVALAQGWSATTSAARANSDYYPFARLGVPAIAVIPGPGPYQGLTTDSSNALRRRWDFYHRPGDEYAAEFPMAGLQRYAEYAYRIGMALDRGLDDGPMRPLRRPE